MHMYQKQRYLECVGSSQGHVNTERKKFPWRPAPCVGSAGSEHTDCVLIFQMRKCHNLADNCWGANSTRLETLRDNKLATLNALPFCHFARMCVLKTCLSLHVLYEAVLRSTYCNNRKCRNIYKKEKTIYFFSFFSSL